MSVRVCVSVCQPVKMWTGKQLFQMLLMPNRNKRYLINLETREKNVYSRDTYMDPKDGCMLHCLSVFCLFAMC